MTDRFVPLAKYDRSRLSLKEAQQHLNQMLGLLATATQNTCQRWYAYLLENIATNLLPVRPNRLEPRVVKRSSKPFPRMGQLRSVLKAKLAV